MSINEMICKLTWVSGLLEGLSYGASEAAANGMLTAGEIMDSVIGSLAEMQEGGKSCG